VTRSVFSTARAAARDRKPLAATTDAELLLSLADRVRRLALMHTDPEPFFAERSDIAQQLFKMSRRLSGQPERRKPTTTWRPPDDRSS
jgi:hypothetical protein